MSFNFFTDNVTNERKLQDSGLDILYWIYQSLQKICKSRGQSGINGHSLQFHKIPEKLDTKYFVGQFSYKKGENKTIFLIFARKYREKNSTP